MKTLVLGKYISVGNAVILNNQILYIVKIVTHRTNTVEYVVFNCTTELNETMHIDNEIYYYVVDSAHTAQKYTQYVNPKRLKERIQTAAFEKGGIICECGTINPARFLRCMEETCGKFLRRSERLKYD